MNWKLVELMEFMESGIYWKWHVNPPVDDMLRYLMQEGCCEAREDIAPDLLRLTQKGRDALEYARDIAAQEAKKMADEEAREAKRLKERIEDKADEERRYRGQKNATIIAACLSASIGFFLGLLADHYGNIVDVVIKLLHG